MDSSARRKAFGAPGIGPRWTRSDKEAVGTAYSASSRIWFTLSAGIVSEVYFPTIDRPQIRDLQFLITDGETFFHDERRHVKNKIEQIAPSALGFRLTNKGLGQEYRIVKEVITDPHHACLLVHTRLEADELLLPKLRLYALLAPHLASGGAGNSGYTADVAGHRILVAYKDGFWLAMGATNPLLKRSCGYVGASDGWTDLHDNMKMDWEFDEALHGNIALTAEIDVSESREFTLAVALGDSRHDAQNALLRALGVSFDTHRARFIEQWQRACHRTTPLDTAAADGGALYRRSHSLLLAHEDKHFPGAMIASLSIPWGEHKGDEDLGGYHLVWPRDMVHSSTALLATGNTETPYRSLVYLACSQLASGGFYQSFWLNGDPYWTGVQLDQVSFAILLAWRVQREQGLRNFDPYEMVMRAAGYLVREGPATAQERWEENSGYSPSTLASNIAALVCASQMAEARGDQARARFLLDYADFLEANLDRWTATSQGTLVRGIPRHYIRILPVDQSDPVAPEDPNTATLGIKNRPPGAQWQFPAKDVVDGGFLELVRYGIRDANDPLVRDSVRVIDHVLRVETPYGPSWRRYNHDGYGQRDDGGPFDGWGTGRAWPLLTGERGHYELAAGRDPKPYLHAMERFAAQGLLAEQVWDVENLPEKRLLIGRPTGAAMPLVWAHAEYLTLLRSIADGRPYDLLPAVASRYAARVARDTPQIWKLNRHARSVVAGQTLRVLAPADFVLHLTTDEWHNASDVRATDVGLDVHWVDIPTTREQRAPLRFTIYWPAEDRWEGRDYAVSVEQPT